MESTGVYWIPLFGVLEERGFELDFTQKLEKVKRQGKLA